MFRTITIVSLMTSFLIVGCGSSSNHHSAPSSSSSSNSSSSSVSNLGNPMNTWGYYGEGVMLGSEPIVGNWIITYTNGNQDTFSFYDDGTGEHGYYGDISFGGGTDYGVNEDGTQLTVTAPTELTSAQDEPTSFTCIKFENACCYINDDEALCKRAP